jgi:membrane associated rhomboid family serine protease
MPLIAEGAAGAVLGFLFGLLLAYLVELRRRYNAQYNW